VRICTTPEYWTEGLRGWSFLQYRVEAGELTAAFAMSELFGSHERVEPRIFVRGSAGESIESGPIVLDAAVWKACRTITIFASEPRTTDDVYVFASRHVPIRWSIEERVVGSANPVVAWRHETDVVNVADLESFSGPLAVASSPTLVLGPTSHQASVGGHLSSMIEHGIYGTFGFGDFTPAAGEYHVEGPQGERFESCFEYRSEGLCKSPEGSWTSEQFASPHAGRYVFKPSVAVGPSHEDRLGAIWIDAPMPPGVTVPAPSSALPPIT